MRATRPEDDGWRSTLLYNTLGPGAWDIVSLEATLKTEGGIAKRVPLIETGISRARTDAQRGLGGACGCRDGGGSEAGTV